MLIKYTFLVLIFIATQLLMFVIRLKDDEKKTVRRFSIILLISYILVDAFISILSML